MQVYSPTVVSGKLEPFGGAIDDDESTYRVKQDQARDLPHARELECPKREVPNHVSMAHHYFVCVLQFSVMHG